MLTGPGDSMLLPFGGFFGSQSESETAKYSWLKVSQREKKKKATKYEWKCLYDGAWII